MWWLRSWKNFVLDIKQIRKSTSGSGAFERRGNYDIQPLKQLISNNGNSKGRIATQARSNEIGKLVGQKIPGTNLKLQKFRAFANKAIKSKPRLAN